MRLRLLFPVLALSLAASACGGDDTDADASTGDADVTDRGSMSPLLGRTFVAESVTENGQPRTPVEGTQIELTFHDDGRLTATAGCNHIGGEVSIASDQLVVEELGTTAMGCDQALHDQDDWLSGVIFADPSFALDGDRLRLEGNGSVIELVDQTAAEPEGPPESTPAPEPTVPGSAPVVPGQPLEGTVWNVDGMISGDSISSLTPGTGATLTFRDGRVEVQVDGCNQGSSPVTIGEAEIEVGPLAMTRMGCPPDVTALESTITTVLDGAVTYTINATSLTLTHPTGAGLSLKAQ